MSIFNFTIDQIILKVTMIKPCTFIILGIFLASGVQSQDYKKEWTEGKLTWEDFTERKGTPVTSELKYFLGFNTVKHHLGDTTLLRIDAIGYMDRKLSWINPDFRNDQLLRYNQVIFDIVEVYRRRLQFELDHVTGMYETGAKFDQIIRMCNGETEKFREASNAGQNMNSIVFWEQKTADELQSLPDYTIPPFKPGGIGYALHGGLGSGIFTGSLGQHFTPAFNMLFGFDLAYRKSNLYMIATLATDRIKKDYGFDSWKKGQRANVAILDISYGYAVIDNTWLKLSPFAGLGLTEFTSPDKNEQGDYLHMDDLNLIFGVNTDFKLRTHISLLPSTFLSIKEKTETSVRARLYITRANFYGDLQGYSINFTLGICVFANPVRIN